MKFKALANFVPVEKLKEAAWEQTRDLTERHDVPHDDDVPEDLRDIKGHYRQTKNGYRISGRLLPSDLLQGSPSSAIGVFMALTSLVAIFAVVMSELGAWTQVVMIPLLLLFSLSCFIAVGFLYGIFAFVFLVAIVGGSSVPGVPTAIQVGKNAGALILVFSPFIYSFLLKRTRALKLADRGSRIIHESVGNLSSAHHGARASQADNAKKDKTPFIKLGHAKGVFHRTQDPFSPDIGLPFGLSCSDLSTHFAVFGATGTGKTSGILRPITNQYLDSGYGGALILDGKGQLASEFRDRPNYTYIEPGIVKLGLLEGLDAPSIVQAIMSTQSDGGDRGENSAFFLSSGQQLLLATAVILCKLNEKGKDKYPLTFKTLYNLMEALSVKEKADPVTTYLKQFSTEDPLLSDAIQYFNVTMPQMDGKTRSNIIAVCNSWLSPVMQHPKIREWATVESGVDVSICLRGGVVGLNVPSSEYGEAGRVVTSLLKTRIFNAIKLRPSDWKKNGEDKPVLMVVDEAQSVISQMELDMFPIARSLGMMGLYATQSVDEYVARFGKDKAYSLMNNFRSFASFSSSPLTYEWAAAKIGTSIVSEGVVESPSADAAFAAQIAAGSPLFDKEHPFRKEMRSFARGSTFGVWNVAKSGIGLFLGGGIELDHKTSVQTGEVQIFTTTLADIQLAEPFTAVVQVLRGGVPRRDLVKVEPMFSE